MRYFSMLILLLVMMFVSNARQNESFAAAAQSGTAQDHVADQADTSGKDVYERACAACHDAGIAGAIKLSDKATWKKHLHHGLDHMVESVIEGKGAMPPRGGSPNLTNEEIEAAVHYIVEQTQ